MFGGHPTQHGNGIPPKFPTSKTPQSTPATKHKRPYAVDWPGGLFAVFCKQNDRQGTEHCARINNPTSSARAGGSLIAVLLQSWRVCGGWWVEHCPAGLERNRFFRAVRSLSVCAKYPNQLDSPRNQDKAAVRQTARKPGITTQARADRCRKERL